MKGARMPQVRVHGKYLGGAIREYDKKDGTKGLGGSYWLWDEEGQEALELRPQRDLAYPVARDLFSGVKFGDEVSANVDVRVWDNKASYNVVSVIKAKVS